ncbi:SusD/RagB family nutrient-binding outer membrane lipoprotein [Flavobacterium gilvum]|uniref:SusD/RagB family nutrient-binding outer membrane lipoprotein n=1 Tax=Flavobacterium gilvum TaxID=1492737 RepID=A0AAC9I634_9FLAO|nr:SusD/RagB family nutrient-binding outer membrane lipoprotein [Flavobacterium gilvum]AOW10282.1 hypothetical protein EM308_12630 [Flavobacterium gilvum]KFC59409.1 hypothetical protein FEM08_18120 [Flavobacterium gilvum]
MKNKFKKYIGIGIGCVFSLTSCDRGFEEMNQNPNAYTQADINSMFTNNEVLMRGFQYSHYQADIQFVSLAMQHLASLRTNQFHGDKYLYEDNTSGGFFQEYENGIKEITHLLSVIPNTPENVNKISAARVIKVYMFHQITDLYGDIPYSQAGKGYLDGIWSPKYDRQQDIYMDMLKELDESALAFNESKPFYGNADVLYGGNVTNWRKFTYSLMLRLGMRISKADAVNAEKYVKKAIAGGVFASNSDNMVCLHKSGSQFTVNPVIYNFLTDGTVDDPQKGEKISKTFIDLLKSTQDPRMRVLSNIVISNNNYDVDPTHQKGMPNGYTDETIKTYPNFTGKQDYSFPNRLTIAREDAPDIRISYAETQLLKAEAAVRGWDSGNAKTYYDSGVTAAMQMLAVYGTGNGKVPIITNAEISTYLLANPFSIGTTAQKIQQIITQKWIAFFLFNGLEAYADYRRTGYPNLVPVNYPGNVSNGQIPRRLIYKDSERTLNTANYNAAVAQQGPDLFVTRIWWDK